MKHGETRVVPALAKHVVLLDDADDAADRRADEDAGAGGVDARRRPRRAHASRAAASASRTLRSSRRASFGPTTDSGSKPLHLGGDPDREVARVERTRSSPTPLRPATAASHVDCASSPSGVTAPSPVTTTRRMKAESVVASGHGPVAHRAPASRSSGRPTCTRRSRSRRWRPSSSASFPRATTGSTSRSGTASAACSRTASGELRLWSRNARPLLRYFPELRPLEKLLPPLSALDGEIVIERDGVLDFDAMQTRLHPAESRINRLVGRDSRALHRLRRARVERRRGLARAARRSAVRASSAARSASSSPPRRATATRRSAGSTASRRSGSTA